VRDLKAVLVGCGILTLVRVVFAAGTVRMQTRIVSALDAEPLLPPMSEELAVVNPVPLENAVNQMVSAVAVAARDKTKAAC
jgi:hypothetical protein